MNPATGKGPLGQSGVEPSSTVKQSYETEFVGRPSQIVQDALGAIPSGSNGSSVDHVA
jgi:hypothetical protein